MKLDKIKFAKLIGLMQYFISNRNTLSEEDINDIDYIIDIEVPEPQIVRPSNENVERLMALMVEGTKKIDAIKEYRAITGMGLIESKNSVERYWPDGSKKLFSVADLRSKLNTGEWDTGRYSVIEAFIMSL